MLCLHCGAEARTYMRQRFPEPTQLYVVCDCCGNRGWLVDVRRDPTRYEFAA